MSPMAAAAPCICIPFQVWPIGSAIMLFLVLFIWFCLRFRGKSFIYFDAEDFAHSRNVGDRELPLSAPSGTFASHLKNYIGVTKLLITVSAASIAFGPNPALKSGVIVAKVTLACSILYGVAFAACLQFFYEEYGQNLRAYKPWKYALVIALGISCFVCFFFGYLIWAITLG
jgi:hypothetical protein